MQRRLSLVALVLFFAWPLLAQDLTVDQILAKNIAAHGGAAKLKAIKTAKISGKILASGIEAPMTMYMVRPDQLRMEFTVQDLTGVRAYDGQSKIGWAIMPFIGKKDPEQMSADDVKQFAQLAADGIEGPFLDYQAKGNKIELLGKEKVEGSDAYKLKLTRSNGNVQVFYIDANSFLEVRTVSRRTIRGSETDVDMDTSDYKAVDGVVVPFSLDSGIKDNPNREKVIFDKYEFNVPVDHAIFVMPVVPKTATAEEKKEPTPAKPPPPPAEDKPKADQPK